MGAPDDLYGKGGQADGAKLVLPTHIGIIMDGNGRWAKAHHLPRLEGHRQGTENVRRLVKSILRYKIPYLTLYAFSTENWARPRQEVEGLIAILEEFIDIRLAELQQDGVKLRHIGRLEHLPPRLQEKVRNAIEVTKDNENLTLCLAWDYGGRDEIVQAVKAIVASGARQEDIDEASFSSHLYTAGIPDPDLIIRTSGEQRLSNFLIWQAAYAEYYTAAVNWPDFTEENLRQALQEYSLRERRFGDILQDEGIRSGP
jgi:undecaprenyl diphosphate synthase